jgi:threonine dehydratase
LGPENHNTFNLNQRYVDKTVLVTENEIAAGMTFALEKEHLVVEGGGAVGIAALLAGKVKDMGERVALVISGSNVGLGSLMEVAQGIYQYQTTA